jgi:hypothetical protein
MPFVKLDTGLLDSSLWIDREAREVFITSLLMCDPWALTTPQPQFHVRELVHTGFSVPAGFYGLVHAAGVGIVRRAGVEFEAGLSALERLGAPDADSRSADYGGRRLVRIDGGYVVLNYFNYRDRDYTGAERAKRYRDNKKLVASRRDAVTRARDVTQGEEEADADGD